MQGESKRIVCVDLNGVLNLFDGFRGGDYFHPVRPGARVFLEEIQAAGFRVVVFTDRWAPHVEEWLVTNGLADYVDEVSNIKPAAHAFIDDRAICFKGDFAAALSELRHFKAHWE